MTRDEHRPFEELAVGYALHALEPEDDLVFSAHLAGCEDCRQAVAEHAEVLAQLAGSVRAEEPPPSVLQGLRAAVAAEPRQPAPSVVAAPPRPVTPLPTIAAQRSSDDRTLGVRRGPLAVAVAAVAALVLGLGGWNASLLRDRDQQAARGDSLARAVEALERDGTRTVRLTGPDQAVRVVAVLGDEQMSLVVKGLEPNPDDTVYVMWGQTPSGAVRAVGAFDVDSGEVDVLEGMPAPDADGLARLMVTREQGRTPPVTTDQPILASGSV